MVSFFKIYCNHRNLFKTILIFYCFVTSWYFMNLSQRNEQPKKIIEKVRQIEYKCNETSKVIKKWDFYDHPLHPTFPLSGSLKSPIPQYYLGEISNHSDIVIGIPTVKRDEANYLTETLESLLLDQNFEDQKAQIVIFVAEDDLLYVKKVGQDIQKKFSKYFHSHQLQVIGPPTRYYPKWNRVVRPTLGDSFVRSMWRSKQNLDQIFLMMYVYQHFPKYYLMMEDDVIAKKGYLNDIFTEIRRFQRYDWFYVSFCQLGAIGKLFKTSTLPALASFIHIFWNMKPLDWLLRDYVQVGWCSFDEDQKDCIRHRVSQIPAVKNALFQHIGRYSSLKGKLQELKDDTFEKNR